MTLRLFDYFVAVNHQKENTTFEATKTAKTGRSL
jgi:hypothetical protein